LFYCLFMIVPVVSLVIMRYGLESYLKANPVPFLYLSQTSTYISVIVFHYVLHVMC